MSENQGRNHLVTRFQCTDCGGYLNLSYEPKVKGDHLAYRDEVVTGALKVEQTVYVEPCGKCVREAREPLRMMREALSAVGP